MNPEPPVKTRLPMPFAAALALCAATLAGGPACAQQQQTEAGYAPDAALMKQVETMAHGNATALDAGTAPGKPPRIEVKVGQLDPRLHLAACAKVEPYLPPGLPVWGKTRIGLRCVQGSRLWNVSIPVTVSVFAEATVLKENLPAGAVLDASQLMQAEVDIAGGSGAAVTDPQQAVGRTLGRNIGAGTALRQNDLRARQFFAPGETVRVVAIGPGWQVVTEGQAVGAGIEGQMTRVRTESGRILTARPSADRTVEVAL